MKKLIFLSFFIVIFLSFKVYAELKFQKSVQFCQDKKLEHIESIKVSKVTGIDELKFVDAKCGKNGNCIEIQAFHKKKQMAKIKDPFSLQDCQCQEKADERTSSCFLETAPFQFEKNHRGLLIRVAQGGEAIHYEYRLFDLVGDKLVSLWEAQYGTNEIMSIENSVLDIVDRDKNGSDEILYSETTKHSSGPYAAEQVDDIQFSYLEYEGKSKKLTAKKPFVVYAVKLKELVNHKVAMAFYNTLQCPTEKILVLEKNKKFEALTRAQRVVVRMTSSEDEAKRLKKELVNCGKGLKPEIVKLDF